MMVMTDALNAFSVLVASHDMMYSFSDDSRAHRAGSEQRKAIDELARQLPPEQAAAIWNAAVDRRIAPDFRDGFYWRRSEAA